jgi:hypothetical protein
MLTDPRTGTPLPCGSSSIHVIFKGGSGQQRQSHDMGGQLQDFTHAEHLQPLTVAIRPWTLLTRSLAGPASGSGVSWLPCWSHPHRIGFGFFGGQKSPDGCSQTAPCVNLM